MRPPTPDELIERAKRYSRSTEYAGKMLAHLDEAGCSLSSLVIFGDGSGHFVISHGSLITADAVFKRFLGKIPYKSVSRERPPDMEYSLDYDTFDDYREACPTCGKPFTEEAQGCSWSS